VRKIVLLLLGSLNMLLCFAQKSYGVEQDYYIYQNEHNSLVPLVYYQTQNNWYTSLRYNYEEEETLSIQLGKTFSKEGTVSFYITPLAGLLAGKFTGASIGALAELEVGKFSLYTEPEYCFKFNKPGSNFFYNWSELSIQPFKFFYSGVALQTIKTRGEAFLFEPGVVLGFTVKNFEIPFYFFRSSPASNYLVAGVHWRLEK
jgi:hypothetical protein